MKYWRGYLTAAIFAAVTLGLMQIAARYTALVDMVYPYMTRTVQNFLAEWTAPLAFPLWQFAVIMGVVLLLTTVVLMIVLKWSFVQWLGWVLASATMVTFLHTGVYGLNRYAGPLSDDLRMDMAEFTVEDLEDATIYFRDQANLLAAQMERDEESNLVFDSFEELSEQAGTGFQTLVDDHYYSVFAGTTTGVKPLQWQKLYTALGVTDVFFPLTGEVSVNPQIPVIALPTTMCSGIAQRLSISNASDADFAAFLACHANENMQFQYAAYFMAYRSCLDALVNAGIEEAAAAAARIKTGVNSYLSHDLKAYDRFFATHRNAKAVDMADSITGVYQSVLRIQPQESGTLAVLLVNWYIQEQVLPYLDQEEITGFDPMDEEQVDISEIIGRKR